MTVTHYTEPKCVESWASAANAKSGGAHSEFLLNSIAGLKYGGRSLDLRGRASLEQPFAKDAAITLICSLSESCSTRWRQGSCRFGVTPQG